MAGVIPPIFASSIILMPATVANWFSSGDSMRWLKTLQQPSPGQPVYVMLYAAAIVFFASSTPLSCSTARNGRQPEEEWCIYSRNSTGRPYGKIIDKILLRLTLAGAIYITFVCLLPGF